MPFNLSFVELLIVGVIAVLLFGDRLPEVGRSVGKQLMAQCAPTMKKVSFSTSAARPRKTKKIICVTDGISSTITKSEGCSQEKSAR